MFLHSLFCFFFISALLHSYFEASPVLTRQNRHNVAHTNSEGSHTALLGEIRRLPFRGTNLTPQSQLFQRNKNGKLVRVRPQKPEVQSNPDDDREILNEAIQAPKRNLLEQQVPPEKTKEPEQKKESEQTKTLEPQEKQEKPSQPEPPHIKEPIERSDIVKVGGTDENPILADWTNEILEITPETNEHYQEYFQTWKDREEMNSQPVEEIIKWLWYTLVTEHPRTNSVHNPQKELFLQKEYSGNAIGPSHLHYPHYKKRYDALLEMWRLKKDEWKNHEFKLTLGFTEQDKYPTIIDETDSKDSDGYYDTIDSYYPVALELYHLHKDEDQRWESIVSEKKQIRLFSSKPNEDPTYLVPDLTARVIRKGDRLYDRVHQKYSENESVRLRALPVEDILKLGKVIKCRYNDIQNLCMEGLPLYGAIVPSDPEYTVFWDAFIKGRSEQRRQEVLDEISLHEIRALKGVNGEGRVYFDKSLNHGPIHSKDANYSYYKNGWTIFKKHCGTDLTCHDIEAKEVEPGKYTFIDYTEEEKQIGLDDPENENYFNAWRKIQEIKDKVEHPGTFLSAALENEIQLIPKEGFLPSFDADGEVIEPFSIEWYYYRIQYLEEQENRRRLQIRVEQANQPKPSN